MNVIVHYPTTISGWHRHIKHTISGHEEYVREYVNRMKLTKAKKKQLIRDILWDTHK